MSDAFPTYPTILLGAAVIDARVNSIEFDDSTFNVTQIEAGKVLVEGLGGGSGSVSGQTNGIPISVTNDFADGVHAYTMSETSLAVGTKMTYSAKLQTSNSDTPLAAYYRTDMTIGGSLFQFGLETPVINDSGLNSQGNVEGIFQIIDNLDDTFSIAAQVTITLFDPDNSSTATYVSTQFTQQAIVLGTDNLVISSEIQSFSATSTISVLSSSLTKIN